MQIIEKLQMNELAGILIIYVIIKLLNKYLI